MGWSGRGLRGDERGWVGGGELKTWRFQFLHKYWKSRISKRFRRHVGNYLNPCAVNDSIKTRQTGEEVYYNYFYYYYLWISGLPLASITRDIWRWITRPGNCNVFVKKWKQRWRTLGHNSGIQFQPWQNQPLPPGWETKYDGSIGR